MEEKVADPKSKEKHLIHLPTRPIRVNCPPILREGSEAAFRALRKVPKLAFQPFSNKFFISARGPSMTRFIFVTGGVVSSLGKGIASASLAAILETLRSSS